MKKLLLAVVFFVPFSVSAFEPLTLAQLDLDLQLITLCESHYRDVVVMDVNNRLSWSHFQWQIHSFLHYGKKYGILPPEFTWHEAEILVRNPWVSSAIARATIDDVGYSPWTNCSRKWGLI